MDTLGKGPIHILDWTGQDSARFYHITQNDAQFKTYEFFISRIFHLLFSDSSLLMITETMESENVNK